MRHQQQDFLQKSAVVIQMAVAAAVAVQVGAVATEVFEHLPAGDFQPLSLPSKFAAALAVELTDLIVFAELIRQNPRSTVFQNRPLADSALWAAVVELEVDVVLRMSSPDVGKSDSSRKIQADLSEHPQA